MQVTKEEVQTLAQSLGIDQIGFTTAEPFEEMRPSLEEQKAAGHTTGFEHPNLDERLNPRLLLPGAQSIIAIALAYPSQIPDPLPSEAGARRGQFARASWGRDYHFILREKLDQLIQALQERHPEAEFLPMVDTGALIDTAVAKRAGLGFIGRNGLLITERFGSYVYLGEVITTLKFQPDEEVPFGCGDCQRCIRSCPPGALLGDGRMNGQVCLSYQTQTKNYMPEKYRRLIGHTIYGCDICQMTCPYNQGIDWHLHEEMEPDPHVVQPALEPMLTLSNRQFRETYGDLAGSWRGKKPLQRNAIIALANYRDQTALPTLIQVLEEDPRPMIRGTAAWAISQIQRYYHPVLIECLEDQRARESDPETIEEMTQAVERLKKKRLPRDDRKKES